MVHFLFKPTDVSHDAVYLISENICKTKFLKGNSILQ